MQSGKTIEWLEAENAALRQRVASLEEKVLLLLQRLEGKYVWKGWLLANICPLETTMSPNLLITFFLTVRHAIAISTQGSYALLK